MGIVLQNPSDNLLEELTAIEQVELAARIRGVAGGPATELLDVVGMGDARTRPSRPSSPAASSSEWRSPPPPSGDPVLLADEPTAQLDAVAGQALIGAMRDLVETGTTLIVTSHDEAVIQAADHVVHLRDGQRRPMTTTPGLEVRVQVDGVHLAFAGDGGPRPVLTGVDLEVADRRGRRHRRTVRVREDHAPHRHRRSRGT